MKLLFLFSFTHTIDRITVLSSLPDANAHGFIAHSKSFDAQFFDGAKTTSSSFLSMQTKFADLIAPQYVSFGSIGKIQSLSSSTVSRLSVKFTGTHFEPRKIKRFVVET